MKVLELFAGSRSIGKQAEKLGMRVFSSDIEPFDGIDYVADILNFDVSKVPFLPDIVRASIPCQGFSVASIGKHWNIDNTPKTEKAKLSIKIAEKTVEIIEHFNPKFWFIENPRGKLRKLNIIRIRGGQICTVTYCQYGDNRMKPTDIWTNSTQWIPRPMCKNGDGCHEAAPRGSKTGTQGLRGDYERSKIPDLLCHEILQSCIEPMRAKNTLF